MSREVVGFRRMKGNVSYKDRRIPLRSARGRFAPEPPLARRPAHASATGWRSPTVTAWPWPRVCAAAVVRRVGKGAPTTLFINRA